MPPRPPYSHTHTRPPAFRGGGLHSHLPTPAAASSSPSPTQLHLAQYLPFIHASHDGLPTFTMLAIGAAFSLSHGCSLAVILAWYQMILVPAEAKPVPSHQETALYIATGAVALPFFWLGVRRLLLLLQTDLASRSAVTPLEATPVANSTQAAAEVALGEPVGEMIAAEAAMWIAREEERLGACERELEHMRLEAQRTAEVDREREATAQGLAAVGGRQQLEEQVRELECQAKAARADAQRSEQAAREESIAAIEAKATRQKAALVEQIKQREAEAGEAREAQQDAPAQLKEELTAKEETAEKERQLLELRLLDHERETQEARKVEQELATGTFAREGEASRAAAALLEVERQRRELEDELTQREGETQEARVAQLKAADEERQRALAARKAAVSKAWQALAERRNAQREVIEAAVGPMAVGGTAAAEVTTREREAREAVAARIAGLLGADSLLPSCSSPVRSSAELPGGAPHVTFVGLPSKLDSLPSDQGQPTAIAMPAAAEIAGRARQISISRQVRARQKLNERRCGRSVETNGAQPGLGSPPLSHSCTKAGAAQHDTPRRATASWVREAVGSAHVVAAVAAAAGAAASAAATFTSEGVHGSIRSLGRCSAQGSLSAIQSRVERARSANSMARDTRCRDRVERARAALSRSGTPGTQGTLSTMQSRVERAHSANSEARDARCRDRVERARAVGSGRCFWRPESGSSRGSSSVLRDASAADTALASDNDASPAAPAALPAAPAALPAAPAALPAARLAWGRAAPRPVQLPGAAPNQPARLAWGRAYTSVRAGSTPLPGVAPGVAQAHGDGRPLATPPLWSHASRPACESTPDGRCSSGTDRSTVVSTSL